MYFMKRIFKIIVVVFTLLLASLISIPYFFKKEIKATITKEVNNTINANFSFEDVSINLFSNFPNATISLEEILITNFAPFEKDTLVFVKSIEVKTSISNLIEKKLILDNFEVSDAKISLKTNKQNVSNYDILKESNSSEQIEPKDIDESSLTLHIEKYSFNNVDFQYVDEKSNYHIDAKNFNHNGTGVFSNEYVDLNTDSSIENFSMAMDNVNYLNKVYINWKALLNLNTENLKVTFKENIAKLNDLSLSFHGFVQPLETGIFMDLDFDSKGSKFKSLLSLIPSAYASDFEHINATGLLNFNGVAKGLYADNEVPKFNLFINTTNASFQYPALVKGIEHITIDAKIENKTGKLDDTEVAIKKFKFQIDEDTFSASSDLSHLMSNPKVKASLNGTINLKNLKQAYPLDLEEELEGVLQFNINTAFTQQAVEKEKYNEIRNSGFIAIEKMNVVTDMLPNPIAINSSKIKFTPKNLVLEKFDATTASSDLSATGTLSNLMGFVFSNKTLEGNFNINSTHINTFDFLSTEETVIQENNSKKIDTLHESQIKIPSKINITANVKAEKVSYDNIYLENLKGEMQIENQQAIFKKTTAEMLGGTIKLNGNVNTQSTPSIFNFDMSMQKIDIAKSFATIELFSVIAPISNAINGNMSTSLALSGNLDTDFFPEMNTLTGAGNTKLEVQEISPKESATITQLNNNFNLIDFDKLDMKKVQTALTFENSKVQFSPFKIASYDGNAIEMSGSHSFENKMDYNLSTNIPVQLLGKQAKSLLAGLSDDELNNMTVPIKIDISGNITSPKVTPDYKSALSVIASKVVESQKNKLIESILNENKKEGDTAKASGNDLEKAAKNLLKSLF